MKLLASWAKDEGNATIQINNVVSGLKRDDL